MRYKALIDAERKVILSLDSHKLSLTSLSLKRRRTTTRLLRNWTSYTE